MANRALKDEAGKVIDELRTLASDIFGDARVNLTASVERRLDPAVWKTLEETGLARLTGSAAAGGSEGGWAEAAVVLSEAAAAGVPVPLLEHDLLAGWLRDSAGLPTNSSGLATSAQVSAGGRQVSVSWLSAAESIVVLDTSAAAPRVYELDVTDLDITSRAGISGEPRDIVMLPAGIDSAVEVERSQADEWLYRGALGRAIQMAGAAETISRLCIEHATARVQFGRPIGRFQAVQHLVTDIACEAAMSRTVVDRAVSAAAAVGLQDVRTQFLVAAAKACTGGAAETLVRSAHQIHGAIGTTLEHSLQHSTRALMEWRREFGSTAEWENRLEDLVLKQGQDMWELMTQ